MAGSCDVRKENLAEQDCTPGVTAVLHIVHANVKRRRISSPYVGIITCLLILRTASRVKSEKVTGGWRKLHEARNLWSAINVMYCNVMKGNQIKRNEIK
jgi:hypothetical protein